jgi:hypothetical protein
MFVGYAGYIHRLTNEYTTTYIHRLINECIGICSSIEAIFFDFGTEEYIIIIFLDTVEYKNIEKYTLFS